MKSIRFYESLSGRWCQHRGVLEGFTRNTSKELDDFLKTPIKVVTVTQSSSTLNQTMFITCITVWYEDAESDPKAFLKEPVSAIEWSVRVSKVLQNANITTLGQLVCKTEWEMRKYRHFGNKSLREVKEKLAMRGLTLGMNIES